MNVVLKKIEDLKGYDKNARMHSKAQIKEIANSIKNFGFNDPIEITPDNVILSGHGRLEAALLLKLKEVPTITHSHLTETQRKAYILAANRIALSSTWNVDLLRDEFLDLKEDAFDLQITGFTQDEIDEILSDTDFSSDFEDKKIGSLAERFVAPPFSILDARQGYWQDRKREWISMGINSSDGRDAPCLPQSINGEKYKGFDMVSATSIFDPVLCEIAYRWFSPINGIVIDPFAGGSVRGIVAAKLERQYIGLDLRQEQIEANRIQWEDFINNEINEDLQIPIWHCQDSRNISKTLKDVKADFIFSCPPYADLEVYSDDPKDLSTLEYDEFIKAYKEIIFNSCSLLNDNRFACFVIGDIRDKKGFYRNFVSDTINAFLDAGLKLYNEAILVSPIGTMAVRAAKTFLSSRKLVKGHQNVLVFIKGDVKKANEACGNIENFVSVDIDTGELSDGEA